RGTWLHCPRCADLRELAPVGRVRGRAPVRLLDGARVPAAERLSVGRLVRDALSDAAVRPHPGRDRGRDRPHRSSSRRWTPLQEAVTPGCATTRPVVPCCAPCSGSCCLWLPS